MTTAANLGVQAAKRFGDTTNAVISTAQWLEYANQVYNKINRFSPLWPWLETSEQTISFTANVRSANLPTDVLVVNWAYDTTDDYRLIDQMGRGDFFHQDHLRSEVGQPVTYRVRGSVMELNPTPTTNTTVVAECMLQPVALAGGDEPVFPEGYHSVMLDGMLEMAYADDGNMNQARYYKDVFDTELKHMRDSILMARTEMNQPIRDTFWS